MRLFQKTFRRDAIDSWNISSKLNPKLLTAFIRLF
jgi:hypothetical protein